MPAAKPVKFCPPCGRIEADFGTCGAPVTCGVEVNGRAIVPDKDITLVCVPCGITRVVEAGKVMQNNVRWTPKVTCPRTVCEAVVVTAKVPERKPIKLPTAPATGEGNAGDAEQEG